MQYALKEKKSYWQFLAWAIESKGESAVMAYLMAIILTGLFISQGGGFLLEYPEGFVILFILYPLSLWIVLSDHCVYFWKK